MKFSDAEIAEGRKRFEHLPDEELKRQFDIHQGTANRAHHAILAVMKDRKERSDAITEKRHTESVGIAKFALGISALSFVVAIISIIVALSQ